MDLVFRILLNDLYQIIVRLNTLTYPLRELLQMQVDFDWPGAYNEAFGKLSDSWLSYFDESLYRV